MGKQGPCCHCGVTSTPLWRNGPPDKPVLCNACGSRWRTKGSLANYTPLHARIESTDHEDHKNSKLKGVATNKKKEVNVPKRKQNDESLVTPRITPNYSQIQWKVMDEDASNRSSSGSAISNSESCAQFGSAELSDLTGPAQSVVWDSSVPSRKRTCVNRPKQSSVEKLTQDLCAILHEQQSCFSGISEEDLLFDSETPMVSVEIGHGSVLIRHPNSIAREEESEASSLSVDNKQCITNDVRSQPAMTPVHNSTKNVNLPSPKIEKIKIFCGQGMEQRQLKRDNLQHEKEHPVNCSSPLCHLDLKDVLNFEEFMKHLTYEEQSQLLKYLPSVDTAKLPDSLKSMFESSQYEENLISFQQLLAQGVFDPSPGTKADECKAPRRLVLNNSMKCKWVEHQRQLKAEETKGETRPGPLLSGPNATVSTILPNSKESNDIGSYTLPDTKTRMKSMKANTKDQEYVNKEGYSDSSRNLFPLTLDAHAISLDSLHSTDENASQDLLLDMPSSSSFPQAELLIHPAPSIGSHQASTSSSSASPVHAYS